MQPLGRLLDLAGLEAARTDVLAAGRPIDDDSDLLEVRVEAPLGRHHGVAAAVPERRALPAYVTYLWHSASLALVGVIAVLNVGYFIPQDRKLEATVSQELAAAGAGEVQLSDAY